MFIKSWLRRTNPEYKNPSQKAIKQTPTWGCTNTLVHMSDTNILSVHWCLGFKLACNIVEVTIDRQRLTHVVHYLDGRRQRYCRYKFIHAVSACYVFPNLGCFCVSMWCRVPVPYPYWCNLVLSLLDLSLLGTVNSLLPPFLEVSTPKRRNIINMREWTFRVPILLMSVVLSQDFYKLTRPPSQYILSWKNTQLFMLLESIKSSRLYLLGWISTGIMFATLTTELVMDSPLFDWSLRSLWM